MFTKCNLRTQRPINSNYVRLYTIRPNTCHTKDNKCTVTSSDFGATPAAHDINQLCSKSVFVFRKCVEPQHFMITHTVD